MKIEHTPYSILSGLPAYGEIYTSFPDGFYSEGLVVQFNKNDGTSWVGNFEVSITEDCLNFVKELHSKDEILIVAGELVYIFNKNLRVPLVKFYGRFEKHFTYQNFNILISSECIVIIENSKRIIFLNELNYHFISDVTFESGVVNVVTFDYSLPENASMIIHTIILKDLIFDDFRKSNYYLSNSSKLAN